MTEVIQQSNIQQALKIGSYGLAGIGMGAILILASYLGEVLVCMGIAGLVLAIYKLLEKKEK